MARRRGGTDDPAGPGAAVAPLPGACDAPVSRPARAPAEPSQGTAMNLVQRTQDLLTRPRETWPAIAAEPASTASVYREWLVFMAAIPAVAGFVGLTLIGAGAFGFSVRIPLVAGLVHMVVGYVLSLVAVFVVALIVDALAPTFGGSKSPIAALKVVAYGSVAGFLGGLFTLLPSLSLLGLLASLYSVYLIYLGLPVLMKCPSDKAGAYTAVVVVCAVVAMVVFGAISAVVMPTRGLGAMVGGAGDGGLSIRTPDGEVTLDASRMQAAAARAEEARKHLESAQQSGDAAAGGKALGEMMGALAGGGATPIAAQDLKALLPEALGSLKRTSFEASGGQAMGIAGSNAKASYADDRQQVQLTITDLGGMSGMATMAAWAGMTVDKETQDAVEKVYKQGGRTIHEEARKDGSHAEFTVILGNGVIVAATGERVDLATLKTMAGRVDLDALEAMKHPAKT